MASPKDETAFKTQGCQIMNISCLSDYIRNKQINKKIISGKQKLVRSILNVRNIITAFISSSPKARLNANPLQNSGTAQPNDRLNSLD